MRKDSSRKHIKAMLALFCAMFVVLSVYLGYIVSAYGNRWFSSPYNTRVTSQKDSIAAGMLLDRTGVRLAYTDTEGKRQYVGVKKLRRSVCHVVGDVYGQIIGAESMFAKYLLGFDQGIADEFEQLIGTQQRVGSTVLLTIDADLNEYAYDLMDDYWGSVVLMNYKTGEILASVSQPTFDPNYMEDYLSGDKELAASAMVNRTTMGRYTPGSTFKIVTLIAALRYVPDIYTRTFNCDGALVFDRDNGKYLPDVRVNDEDFTKANNDEDIDYNREQEGAEDISAEPAASDIYSIVRDYRSEYHGEIDVFEAFASSCNTTFAKLAMEIGANRLAKVARELGIGDEFLFDDIMLYASSFEKGDTELNVAWSGVGQYKDIMTPMQTCMLTAAIANNGTMMEPRLLYKVADSNNRVKYTAPSSAYKTVLTAAESEFLKEAMLQVVDNGTGTRAAVDGLTVGGKTGTAEISSDKSVKTHAWFTGFILEEDHPLAITVILEQAGGGGSYAAPLAGKLLNKAVKLGY